MMAEGPVKLMTAHNSGFAAMTAAVNKSYAVYSVDSTNLHIHLSACLKWNANANAAPDADAFRLSLSRSGTWVLGAVADFDKLCGTDNPPSIKSDDGQPKESKYTLKNNTKYDPIPAEDEERFTNGDVTNEDETDILLEEHLDAPGSTVDDDSYTKKDCAEIALCAAAEQNELAAVKQLLAAKAAPATRINEQDETGMTALMAAAVEGHGKVVEALIAAGADTKLVNRDGWTAKTWASSAGHAKLFAAKHEEL